MEVQVSQNHDAIDVTTPGAMRVVFKNENVKVGIYPDKLEDGKPHPSAGLPKFEDVEFVTVYYPGGKDFQDFPVNEEHKRRWPRQYAAFKNGEAERPDGFPVEQIAWLTKSQVLTLKTLNIFTKEALSKASDATIDRIGLGGREMRTTAQNELKVAKDAGFVHMLAQQKADQDAEISLLREEVARLSATKSQIKEAK